jgi:AraC-like DNA-binding protein
MDEPLNLPPLVEWRQGMYGVLLEQLRYRQKILYSRDVIEYAKHALRHGVTSQRAVAESAGMSVATLRRRLASRNSRFRDLRDEVLATDALMLIQAGQSVEAIAERLGYADSRSFRRAFKRHFGESPGDYRRRVIGGSSKY